MYNHQLDTFITVADAGSFNKAAEELFITPTAIIQQINLLEARCGFKIFLRTNHGVKLTPAGKSLYDDAKTIIKLSDDILTKATALAEASETTVRIGTSLLYKCRMLQDIWNNVTQRFPELKIEILPMVEYGKRTDTFAALGTRYDLFEGVFADKGWKEICNFLKLTDVPLCCAVSKGHRLAGMKKLSMEDLNGEYIVMPIAGISSALDSFREEITAKFPTVHIIDSPYYGVDTFTLCEVNPYILITQSVYSDIHTNLITLPLESNYALPYGIVYAKEPTTAAKKFIEAARDTI